jgi:primosomal protein N'
MSDPDRATISCAACGWLVYADAVGCKHCRAPREQMAAPTAPADRGLRCPRCDGKVLPSATSCKHCGGALPPA